MRALRTLPVFLVLILAACSASNEPITTTTELPAALADIPEECVDALVGYLRAIEPVVEDIDFENLGTDALERLGTDLQEASGEMAAQIQDLDCPDPVGGDNETFAAVITLAETRAPGTVAYLEWVAAFASDFGESSEVSGDCETDIAAFQAIVDEGGTMSDLTMTQVVEVGSLFASVSTSCSPERAEEFFAQADVAAFLEEG